MFKNIWAAVSHGYVVFMRTLLTIVQIVAIAASLIVVAVIAMAIKEGAADVADPSRGSAKDMLKALPSGWTLEDIFALYTVALIVAIYFLIKTVIVAIYLIKNVWKDTDQELAANKWVYTTISFTFGGLFMPFLCMLVWVKGSKEHKSRRPKMLISRVLSLSLAAGSIIGFIVYLAVVGSMSKITMKNDTVLNATTAVVIALSIIVAGFATTMSVFFFFKNAEENYYKKNSLGTMMKIWADTLCVFVTLEWLLIGVSAVLLWFFSCFRAWKKVKGKWYSPFKWIKVLLLWFCYAVVYFIWLGMVGTAVINMWMNKTSSPAEKFEGLTNDETNTAKITSKSKVKVAA